MKQLKRVTGALSCKKSNDDDPNPIDAPLLKGMLIETMGRAPDDRMWCQIAETVRLLPTEKVRACLQRVARQNPKSYGYVLRALQNEAELVTFRSPSQQREPKPKQEAGPESVTEENAAVQGPVPTTVSAQSAGPNNTAMPAKPVRESHCASCQDTGLVWEGEPRSVRCHQEIQAFMASGQARCCDCSLGLVWREQLKTGQAADVPDGVQGKAQAPVAAVHAKSPSRGPGARVPRTRSARASRSLRRGRHTEAPAERVTENVKRRKK